MVGAWEQTRGTTTERMGGHTNIQTQRENFTGCEEGFMETKKGLEMVSELMKAVAEIIVSIYRGINLLEHLYANSIMITITPEGLALLSPVRLSVRKLRTHSHMRTSMAHCERSHPQRPARDGIQGYIYQPYIISTTGTTV